MSAPVDIQRLTFNTDRDQTHRSISKLAQCGTQIAGFGHGEAILVDAANRLATCTDPFG